MVGGPCAMSIRIKRVNNWKERWCDSIRIKLVPGYELSLDNEFGMINISDVLPTIGAADSRRIMRTDWRKRAYNHEVWTLIIDISVSYKVGLRNTHSNMATTRKMRDPTGIWKPMIVLCMVSVDVDVDLVATGRSYRCTDLGGHDVSSLSKLQHLKSSINKWRSDIQGVESAATAKLRGKLDALDNKAEVGPLTPTDATARAIGIGPRSFFKTFPLDRTKGMESSSKCQALNVALLNACNNNAFHEVKVGKDNIHVSHLQFADDALVMGEWSWLNAMNLSRILTCFNLASGLKINFHKSKLYGVGVTTLEVNSLASMIGCLPSKFPCTYLGLPIGGNMSRPIRSNLELCELLELCSLVAHLRPSDDNGDSWECIIDDSRSFSVKRMHSFINQVSPTLQTGGTFQKLSIAILIR
ncbi:hypothetical protein Tco_0955491 [Tanacetum coccineum]|uniref:Reverse transcriptase domain-containing protein n=1 Tax=Tanacetum coccineum TaxID=301880 RepID=A0ABQ5E7F1_9ASTR